MTKMMKYFVSILQNSVFCGFTPDTFHLDFTLIIISYVKSVKASTQRKLVSKLYKVHFVSETDCKAADYITIS